MAMLQQQVDVRRRHIFIPTMDTTARRKPYIELWCMAILLHVGLELKLEIHDADQAPYTELGPSNSPPAPL